MYNSALTWCVNVQPMEKQNNFCCLTNESINSNLNSNSDSNDAYWYCIMITDLEDINKSNLSMWLWWHSSSHSLFKSIRFVDPIIWNSFSPLICNTQFGNSLKLSTSAIYCPSMFQLNAIWYVTVSYLKFICFSLFVMGLSTCQATYIYM